MPGSRKSPALTRIGILVVTCVALSSPHTVFTGGLWKRIRGGKDSKAPMPPTPPAEAASTTIMPDVTIVEPQVPHRPQPERKTSVALVRISEEAVLTSVSVLGGLVGMFVGGVWLGAGLFAVTSYLARREDDLSLALRGMATGGLEALNFTAELNDKYEVTHQVGSKLSEAVDQSDASHVGGLVNKVKVTIENLDQDIGIQESLGTVLSSVSALASAAVEGVVHLNDKHKLTDQIVEKVQDASKPVAKDSKSE